MIILEFTNNDVFNAMFTIFVYITAVLAPLFAAISLLRN